MCVCTSAALCMLVCTPFCLCEIRRYWSEYIRGFNGAVLNFHFSCCKKRTRQQEEDKESLSFFQSCIFLLLLLPNTQSQMDTLLEEECEWSMESSSVISFTPLLPITPLFHHSGVLWSCWWVDEGRRRRAGSRPSDDATHSVNSPLPLFYLFSIFPSLSTSIPSSLHLLGSRNYLSLCKGASSIPRFIACCQRNGSCFDWIEGVRALVSLLGHSCVCVRDGFWT